MKAREFYNLARNKLPLLLSESREVFGISEYPETDIIWADSSFYKKYGKPIIPFSFCYYLEPRKIVFIPQFFWYFQTEIQTLYNDLESFIIDNLSHESSHLIHDFRTNFEIGKELQVLDKQKKKILVSFCQGTIEGIAEYACMQVLQNLKLYENLKIRKQIIEQNLKHVRDADSINISRIRNYLLFTTTIKYVKEFEQRGIDYFRRFAKDWRPSKISYEDTFELLSDIL